MKSPENSIQVVGTRGHAMTFLTLTFPLLLVNILLLGTSHFLAAIHSIRLFNPLNLLYAASIFPLLFLGSLSVLLIFESIWRVKNFTEHKTGQVNVRKIWRDNYLRSPPLSGAAIVFIMGAGISSSSHLSEIYRITTQTWFDSQLWLIEEPIFHYLLNSQANHPSFWDKIYFFIWPILFGGMAVIYIIGHREKFVEIAIAVVISFYMTRLINLLIPTAGPAFFKPELFSLNGTLSVKVQDGLRLYMLGHLTQNGLIPGTMAMPSLHVGLAALSAWAIACHWRWTLWFTIPWLLLIWLSTIMLGWHYALDGVGGLLVMGLSILVAHYLMKAWHLLIAAFQNKGSFHR